MKGIKGQFGVEISQLRSHPQNFTAILIEETEESKR